MFEFWHNFLYDSNTFACTMWILFVFSILGAFAYFMGKDVYK